MRFLIFIIFLQLFPSQLFAEDNKAQIKEPIKLGALLCLTGVCAEWGTGALEGMKIAIHEINKSGGVDGRKIKLISEDSREEQPPNAVSGYRYLRSFHKVNIIVGPTWTPAGLALAPIASKDKDVLMISPSLGVRDFNESGDNLFNVWPHDEYSSRKMAQFAYEKGWKTVAIFSSQQPWEQEQGRVFEKEFTKLGGKITTREEPLDTTTDLRTEAMNIIRTKPDALYFSAFQHLEIAAQEIKKLGYKGPKLLSLVDESKISKSHGALNKSFYPEHRLEHKSLISRYKEQHKTPPHQSVFCGYDTVQLIVQAIKAAKSDEPIKVQKALLSLKPYEGASEKIAFNKEGGVLRWPEVKQLS